MISDCETCTRKNVPCSACETSQRAICFICQGDIADPYCELEDAPAAQIEITSAGLAAMAEYEQANSQSEAAR